jgi:hypothetical protein
MKNKHYEVILMAFFFLAPQYLQAGEITSTLSFSGYNNSTLSVTTNTNWVSDTIDIKAVSEARYDMYMSVNADTTATGMGRLAYGTGNGSLSVSTYTPWGTDQISIATTGAADRSVLDQFINSAPDGTSISRTALYIGDGSIVALSAYNGFNVPTGETSVMGIYIEGNNYGVLIQRPIVFNAGFGGIKGSVSVAEAGGNCYSVQQFGFVDMDGSGSFTPHSDYGVFTSINGDGSAAITSTDFGSFPGPGSDVFRANTTSWAIGDGAYSFSSESSVERLNVDWAFGWGDSTIIVDDSTLQINDYFSAN